MWLCEVGMGLHLPVYLSNSTLSPLCVTPSSGNHCPLALVGKSKISIPQHYPILVNPTNFSSEWIDLVLGHLQQQGSLTLHVCSTHQSPNVCMHSSSSPVGWIFLRASVMYKLFVWFPMPLQHFQFFCPYINTLYVHSRSCEHKHHSQVYMHLCHLAHHPRERERERV